MSDHISGPRALADPIADITDLYAFPSPAQPQNLVLVMNTLPFAQPGDVFSDGLIYRFRLRPLTRAVPGDTGRRSPPPTTNSCSTASSPLRPAARRTPPTAGYLHPHRRGNGSFQVGDLGGGSGPGMRAFAGVRWDPFIMDAPAALKTIATQKLAFTDPGAIYLDGKDVLSLVVEIDTDVLGGASLIGVVAETLTRGRFNVRIERVGRPEVKNMMLAPKQFDTVNRDLEIRDLYNMEDAFHLQDGYLGAYRARLNANLAFWDGLDGRVDWPADEDGNHPLTALVLADYLVVDVTKPYVEHGSYLEIEIAARTRRTAPDLRGAHPERRRDRHLVHPARQRGERAGHSRRGRPRHPTRGADLPLPGAAQPGPARASPAPLATKACEDRVRDDGAHPRARRHPGRRALRTALAVRRHLSSAAHRRPTGRPRTRRSAAPDRQLCGFAHPDRQQTPRSRSRSPTPAWRRSACPKRPWTASPPSSGKGWPPGQAFSATPAKAVRSIGNHRWVLPRSMWRSRLCPPIRLCCRPRPSGPGAPRKTCRGWR